MSPLVIHKVHKGRVSPDEGGPVSQMQKIALQCVNPDGSQHYLSGAGPIPGTPGVVAPPALGMSTQAGTHPLLFQSPRIRDEMKDGLHIISDEFDNYLCWILFGSLLVPIVYIGSKWLTFGSLCLNTSTLLKKKMIDVCKNHHELMTDSNKISDSAIRF